MYYATRAIMLNSHPQGERGRQLTLLTESRGLVMAQGQGVMPARSKLGSSLTSYRLLSVTVTTRNVERVIGVDVLETFGLLWQDARRQGYAAWAMSAVAECMKPGVADLQLFHLILEYLRILNDNTVDEKTFPLLRLACAVKFIHLLGYHGSGLQGQPFKETADQVVRTDSLKDASNLLLRAQKKVHEQVEAILQEISSKDSFLPAQFLTALNRHV